MVMNEHRYEVENKALKKGDDVSMYKMRWNCKHKYGSTATSDVVVKSQRGGFPFSAFATRINGLCFKSGAKGLWSSVSKQNITPKTERLKED